MLFHRIHDGIFTIILKQDFTDENKKSHTGLCFFICLRSRTAHKVVNHSQYIYIYIYYNRYDKYKEE